MTTKKRAFNTANPNNYKRRAPKKYNNLIMFVPFLNDANKFSIDEEILKIVESTPFGKIQIPLYCSRAITEEGGSETRYVTIGNILTYNKDSKQFKIIINKKFKDIIMDKLNSCEDGEIVAVPQYTTYNGKLSTINKICIEIIDYCEAAYEKDFDDYDAVESDDFEEVDEAEVEEAESYSDDNNCDDGSPM